MNLNEALETLKICEKVESQEKITHILNYIGNNVDDFWVLKGTGDFNFYEAKLLENGEIELYDIKYKKTSTYQIKVKELQVYNIQKQNMKVVRLELDSVSPLSLDFNDSTEEYVELPNGKIIRRYHWDEGMYNGEDLDKQAKLVVRILNGNLVIIPKFKIDSRFYEALTSASKERFEEICR